MNFLILNKSNILCKNFIIQDFGRTMCYFLYFCIFYLFTQFVAIFLGRYNFSVSQNWVLKIYMNYQFFVFPFLSFFSFDRAVFFFHFYFSIFPVCFCQFLTHQIFWSRELIFTSKFFLRYSYHLWISKENKKFPGVLQKQRIWESIWIKCQKKKGNVQPSRGVK